MIKKEDVIKKNIDVLLQDKHIIEESKRLSVKLYNRQEDILSDRFIKLKYGIIAEILLKEIYPESIVLGCTSNNNLAPDLIINNKLIDVKSSIEKNQFNSDEHFINSSLKYRNFTSPVEQKEVKKEYIFQILFFNKQAFLFGFKKIEELCLEKNIKDLIVNKEKGTIQKTYMEPLNTGISISNFV